MKRERKIYYHFIELSSLWRSITFTTAVAWSPLNQHCSHYHPRRPHHSTDQSSPLHRRQSRSWADGHRQTSDVTCPRMDWNPCSSSSLTNKPDWWAAFRFVALVAYCLCRYALASWRSWESHVTLPDDSIDLYQKWIKISENIFVLVKLEVLNENYQWWIVEASWVELSWIEF